jgi:3-keto-5-aminohexanoate cleavage enzyme
MQDPVIIECAINGARTKATNRNVPMAPEEIAADSLACIEAGASVIHNHIDLHGVSQDEAVARYLEGWGPVLAARPDALIYPTVHFGERISYEHLVPLARAGLRIGLCDPGSVNLGGADADGVPTGGLVYANSFETIARVFEICDQEQLGPSLAIYEPGFLQTTLAWWRAGRLPSGAMVKLYFSAERGFAGSAFGLSPTVKALDAYLEMLEGTNLPWAVSLFGGDVIASPVARPALERGGHLHLGLEFYDGDRTPTNAELVNEAVALCSEVGRPVATPDQAAQIVDLPRAARG